MEKLYINENKKRSREGTPPLQGMCYFQGLDIMIENQQGTKRQWGATKDQATHMYYDYGYIVGTMGLDGDEVDVYVGPNSQSQNVFIVTQMKRPDFKEIDEHKVFLGFDTKEQVREAYLHQYDDPRFLGWIETTTVSMFKLRLALTGSTRKALITLTKSAKLKRISNEDKSVDALMEELPESEKISKPFQSQAQRKKFYAMAERGQISHATVKEWEDATPKGKKLPRKKKKMNKALAEAIDILKSVAPDEDDEDTEKGYEGFDKLKGKLKGKVSNPGAVAAAIGRKKYGKKKFQHAAEEGESMKGAKPKKKEKVEKALKASSIAGVAKQYRIHNYVAPAAQEQPTIGTARERGSFEPPVIPVRHVETPIAIIKADSLTDCNQCGYIHKSVDSCPRCTRIRSMDGEALPLHFRGR